MITEILKAYANENQEVSETRIGRLAGILREYDREKLSEIPDGTMHDSLLTAFLFRLERLSDEQLENYDTAMQSEDISFYMEMSDEEKRADARFFTKKNPLVIKAQELHADTMRSVYGNDSGSSGSEESVSSLPERYRELLETFSNIRQTLSFDEIMEFRRLASDITLMLSCGSGKTTQYTYDMHRCAPEVRRKKQESGNE